MNKYGLISVGKNVHALLKWNLLIEISLNLNFSQPSQCQSHTRLTKQEHDYKYTL